MQTEHGAPIGAAAVSAWLRAAGRQRLLKLLSVSLGLALLVGCTSEPRPTPSPTAGPRPSVSLTAERTSAPSGTSVVLTTPLPPLTGTPTVVPRVSGTPELAPSATVPSTLVPTISLATPTSALGSATYWISDVVAFDGAHDRIYAFGRVGEEAKTLALSAASGGLLAVYDHAGALGLDAQHRWLYVDAGGTELQVLDADTGAMLGAVQLPEQVAAQSLAVSPLADPDKGQVLAFRQNVVYVADGVSRRVTQTIPFDFEKSHDCRTGDAPYPIEWAAFDSSRRILYVSYLSYVCTPWFGFGIVSYDLASGQVITRGGDYAFKATVSDGYLYGSSWHRFGIGYLWAWRDGKPSLRSSDWGSQPHFAVDTGRKRLYGEIGGSLGVLDAQTMDLLFAIPLPLDGQLAGFDAVADRLYFLVDGHLGSLPGAQIKEPLAARLTAATTPTTSVDALLISPAWPADSTVAGIWGKTQPMDRCYAFAQQGGVLLLSNDGGENWVGAGAGLPACQYVSCLAVSPDLSEDRTLFVGLVGTGVFRSTDGGRLWQPASVGLGSMNVQELILSPGFASDRTAFARVGTGGPYRSSDGGQTWHALGLPADSLVEQLLLSPGFARDRTLFARLGSGELYRSHDAGLTWQDLGVALQPLALSPEFDQDATILGAAPDGTDLYVSRDGGTRWEPVGKTPAALPLRWLSLAPLFAKWGVAFAQGRDPIPAPTAPGTTAFYRTSDGGQNWQQLFLQSGEPLGAAPDAAMQFLYAADVEENRPVYLLTTEQDFNVPPSKRGQLYRSGDGGITWSIARLPQGVTPTAVTLSPNFATDRLVFVGTADGRVLIVRDDTL